MTSHASRPERFMLHSIVPILCSMIVGFIFAQGDIFDRTHNAFQFVWSAIVMSLFYNLLRDVSPRDAKFGFVVLAFLTMMTTRSMSLSYIVRDLFYVAAMGAAVALYTKYYVRSSLAPTIASGVTFAGLYGMLSVATATCDALLLKVFSVGNPPMSLRQIISGAAVYGLLIGFGVGAGFDLAERWPRAEGAEEEGPDEEEHRLHAGT